LTSFGGSNYHRPEHTPFQERSESGSLLSNRRVAKIASGGTGGRASATEQEEALTANLAKLASIVDRLSGKAKLVPVALQPWGDGEKAVVLHKTLAMDDDTDSDALKAGGLVCACEQAIVVVLCENEPVSCGAKKSGCYF
jgi:hypothetical protein